MGFWLKGTIDEVGCEGEGCVNCPYRIMDTESYACTAENYWSALYKAIALWKLLEDERGQQLYNLLKEEIEINIVDEVPVITLEKIKKVLSLLAGLDEALYAISEKDWFIKPEHIDYVLKNESDLVSSWQNTDGKWVHTLANSLSQVQGAEFFLKGALRVGREVELD
ncbi:helix-turn-helix domain-containing protein [Mastigocoleus testarum]|uniref:Uncharacterized protein n=1 Tax=Mastigocoleus testarum BC008 TaxID=371196 RepID=A0A0V7ZMS1_9CYAN|nr:hypothetical protein [Mastigocoleus testarum]KST65687.1 hypothetical protein BC008_22165 [Mastigocoleus testarum BC008]